MAIQESIIMRNGECLTSQMLWNWETVNSCLISRSWHIKSESQFAGSCIGILLLAMCIPLLRRLARIYDIRILQEYQRRLDETRRQRSSITEKTRRESFVPKKIADIIQHSSKPGRFRPSMIQQLCRAVLHLSQFIIGYFVML
jgi:copper transporter 1